MPEELRNEETLEMEEELNMLTEEETGDDVDLIDTSDTENSSSGIATAVKLGIGVAVVGGLALKGAKDITVDYVVPGLKKAGSFVKTHLPFGKKGKKGKESKDDKIHVVADVEVTEEEIIEE